MFSKLSIIVVAVAIGSLNQTVLVEAVKGSHGAVYSTATETVVANAVACVNSKSYMLTRPTHT